MGLWRTVETDWPNFKIEVFSFTLSLCLIRAITIFPRKNEAKLSWFLRGSRMATFSSTCRLSWLIMDSTHLTASWEATEHKEFTSTVVLEMIVSSLDTCTTLQSKDANLSSMLEKIFFPLHNWSILLATSSLDGIESRCAFSRASIQFCINIDTRDSILRWGISAMIFIKWLQMVELLLIPIQEIMNSQLEWASTSIVLAVVFKALMSTWAASSGHLIHFSSKYWKVETNCWPHNGLTSNSDFYTVMHSLFSLLLRITCPRVDPANLWQ